MMRFTYKMKGMSHDVHVIYDDVNPLWLLVGVAWAYPRYELVLVPLVPVEC